MITLTILLTILLIVATIVAAIALACGAGFVVLFGDLIVCGLIIWLFVKLFKRRKRA
jgi:hypothetical protein